MPTRENSPTMKLLKSSTMYSNSPKHRRMKTNMEFPKTPIVSMAYNHNQTNNSPTLKDNNSSNNLKVPLADPKAKRRQSMRV